MANTENIFTLFQDTLKQLAAGAWPAFLRTAGWNYKYDFPSQVLIFAQMPDAIACADQETWHTKLHRKLLPEASGITLLNDEGAGLTLRQVYDVSETQAPEGTHLPLWQMTPQKETAVQNTLSDTFLEPGTTSLPTASGAFYQTVLSVILADDAKNIADGVKRLQQGSAVLSKMSYEEIYQQIYSLLLPSATASIMYRCGQEPQLPKDGLQHLTLLRDDLVIAFVGSHLQKYTRQCLDLIGKAVRTWDREHEQEETYAYETRQGQLEPAEAAQVESLRNAAQKLPQTHQTGRILHPAHDRSAAFTSQEGRGGDPALGRSASAGRSEAVSAARQRESAAFMAGTHAETEKAGGGAGVSGDYLQVTQNRIPQEELDAVLTSHLLDRSALAALFQQNPSPAEAEEGVREIVGRFRENHVFSDGTEGVVRADYLGFHLKKSVELNSFTWSEITSRLHYLYQGEALDAQEAIFLDASSALLPGKRIYLPSGSEYVVLHVSEDLITLQDAENPLFTQDMPRELLETVIENQNKLKNRKARQLYTKNDDINDINAVFTDNVKQISLTAKMEENTKINTSPPPLAPEIEELFAQDIFLPSAEENYRFLSEYAPEILDGSLDYIRFESDAFEPLYIERRTGSQVAMAHTYLANGELMLDPEVTFHVDKTNGRLYPLSFEQSDFGLHQHVLQEDGDGQVRLNTSQIQSINEFCQMWFQNLKWQGHVPVRGIKHTRSDDLEYRFTDDRVPVLLEKTGIEPITASEMNEDRREDVFFASIPEVHPSDTSAWQHQPYYGGPKTRFQNNIAAIRLLKQLEAEDRMATPDEQEILRRYVGWGGLSNAFDANQKQWQTEYQLLRSLLTEEEYASARESTLTAFYTPPVVTEAIFHGLARLGLRQGNLLDPCCGTGNFFGALPQSMQEMKLHGVELDSISGRICRQLYQQANVSITGYEHSKLPDSFYDAAVGNVPFGDYQLSDRRYDKEHFLVHDYFFAKTLDKVRPGGVIAFITSYGTMDKQNDRVRRYIAQRADLLGAIRLPNGTFQEMAGTDTGADILFLQKRSRPMIQDASWLGLGKTKDIRLPINQYFIDHPEMVLGQLRETSGPYGIRLSCVKREGADLHADLNRAVEQITAQHTITLDELDSPLSDTRDCIPAAPNIRNFSYGVIDGEIYFREDSVMYRMDLGKTVEKRVKGMVQLRDLTRELIDAQVSDESDDVISDLRSRLNLAYDAYVKKHGRLNSIANSRAFSEDASYYLLCSLENLDEDGSFKSKADMFYKRTIGAHQPATHADTPQDALALSMAELGRVDLSYMSTMCDLSESELISALNGMIYPLPGSKDRYELASTYLSGNIREKLDEAKAAAITDNRFLGNVKALESAMPEPLPPNLISVRLGAPWVPAEDVTQFMYELLSPDPYYQEHQLIRVVHSEYNNTWSIINKNWDKDNVRATSAYGTKHADAYRLLEDALNGRDTRIYTWDEEKTRRFVDIEATFAAQEKQRILNERFVDWLWKDPQRRDRLCKIYNDRYNCIVPPSYDGNMVSFPNMNPGIQLEDHQKECVARILYGGNTLLAHEVGAGKTWTMTAAAMEGKRLGLCSKSMIVVPNHLIGQWAKAVYELYPSANVLASTEKDFEMANRKKFCSRIATGDYDIVILGHSQLEKIPLSKERQETSIQMQIDEILSYIQELKEEEAEPFTIKQMESARKKLETRLHKLHNSKQRDDVVTFEELGIDRLFIDESHEFKNLYHYTKMHNVAGIAQTDAQKASDLFLKCRYMDELTDNMGNIHATGTPISNTMAEMYTNQCYLQYDMLKKMDLDHFDAWASTFGETVQVFELAPEGEGFRQRTRFARFYNVPELLNLFKLTADIRTREVLNLPVPEARYKTIPVPASDAQKAYVKLFCQRAANIRKGGVNPSEDNMLCITNDGRKLALDQRLIDPSLPDNPNSKANACADRILDYYKDGQGDLLTQLVFCDLSTPKGNGSFNVYDDLKSKLIARGIPEQEIRFIHEASNTAQKEAIFSRVRSGNIRVLLGSTGRMGTGTNVQDRLIAIHDLDCPYRPSDLEQRAGRGIRRGNSNSYVDINRYVTEGTFDAYMYQLLMSKQRFISQVYTNKNPARVVTDLDDLTLSYAEIMAITSGDPKIMEKVELETEISRLQVLKNSHENEQYRLDRLLRHQLLPSIESTKKRIVALKEDIRLAGQHTRSDSESRIPVVQGCAFETQEAAGQALLAALNTLPDDSDWQVLGHLRGFTLQGARFGKQAPKHLSYAMPQLAVCGALNHPISLSDNAQGTIRRLNHLFDRGLSEKLNQEEKNLNKYRREAENAKAELGQPFPNQASLDEKIARLTVLQKELDIDYTENREGDSTRTLDRMISDARLQKIDQSDTERSRPVRFEESRWQ